MITRGRANEVRNTGKTRPVAVGGICAPSAAASVGATSCCTAGIEYTPVFTAGPPYLVRGIVTSYTGANFEYDRERKCSFYARCGVNVDCPYYPGAYPLAERAQVLTTLLTQP